VFGCAAIVTEPLPVPLPLVMTIQSGAPLVLHAQSLDVVTATVVDPPAAVTLKLVGAIEYAQAEFATACVTVTVWPATVSVALRAAPVFAPMLSVTVPLPPLPPVPVMAIHDGTPLMLQEHSSVAVTVSVDDPPPASMETDEGLTTYVHCGAGPPVPAS
jgi:hypothetical protein